MSVACYAHDFHAALVRCGGARHSTLAGVQTALSGIAECYSHTTSRSPTHFDRGHWEGLGKPAGLLGLLMPDGYGGCDGTLADLALLFHALGASGTALPLFGHVAVAGPAILAGGSEAQRIEWLPRIASGEIIASDGYCPDLTVRAGRLSGVARNVPHGRYADLLVVSNDRETWLVQTAANGVVVECENLADPARPLARIVFTDAPAVSLDDHASAGEALHKTGYLALAAEALGGAATAANLALAMHLLEPTDPRIAAVSDSQRAVLFAVEPVPRDPTMMQIALHRAKAGASTAYLALARHLEIALGPDNLLGITHLARAHGFDRIMGPSAWHLGEVSRLLADEPPRPGTGKIANAS